MCRMNKKAVELSLNFLVTLIIAIVIFGFGVAFVYNIAAGAGGIKDLTTEDIDNQIAELKCARAERICLDRDNINLKPNKLEVIGLKILNIDETSEQFDITTALTKYVNKDNQQEPIPSGTPIDILPAQRTEFIEINTANTFGIGFELGDSAPAGTYVIDIDVQAGGGDYDKTHKIYLSVE